MTIAVYVYIYTTHSMKWSFCFSFSSYTIGTSKWTLKMPPNTTDIPPYDKPEIISLPVVQPKSPVNEYYGLHICQSILNMIGRLCIGIIVGICLTFAFRNGVPLNATSQHIVLCVIGVSTILFFIIAASVNGLHFRPNSLHQNTVSF